jgi:hypothetical protein
MLAHAPAADAPLKQLCEPALAGASPLPGAPTDIHDPTPSARTALAIARSYQEWLGHQLDVAQEGVIVERHLRSTDVERIRQLTEESGHLRNRLADLESRGLLGMIRWRIGLFVRRRKSRREVGDLAR